MNKRIMVLMAVLIISAYAVYPAAAATFTVNYQVTSVTTFTVSTASPMLNFTGNGQAQNIWPDVRNADNSWGNVTNDGNVALTFKASVDTAQTGIRLALSNDSAMTEPKNVSVSPGAWRGSSNVPPLGKVDMYFQANYNVADGSYAQVLTIGT